MHECTHTLTYIWYCCRCSCLIAGHMHILPGVKEWIESCINNGKENVNLLCSDHCTRRCALQKNTHSFTPGRYCLCHCQRSRKIISEIWTSWNKFSATKTLIQIILWAAVKNLISDIFRFLFMRRYFQTLKAYCTIWFLTNWDSFFNWIFDQIDQTRFYRLIREILHSSTKVSSFDVWSDSFHWDELQNWAVFCILSLAE